MRYIKNGVVSDLPTIRANHPNMSIPDGADLADIGYFPLTATPAPEPSPGRRVVAGAFEEVTPNHWRETWQEEAIPLAEMKARRLAELAALRYEKEIAGITVNGAAIETDRASQALITGAWSISQINPTVLIDWKTASGVWVQIDAAVIAGIAAMVAAHVQACFSAERVHAEALAALTTSEAVAAYDLTTGWPG